MRPAARVAASLLVVAASSGPTKAQAPSQPVATAILELDYVDTSDESRDQTAEHEKRLRDFSQALGRDLAATGKYRIVAMACAAQPCTSRVNPDEMKQAAQAAGVRFVAFGGIHKMSTLVQWAKIQIADMDQNRIVFDRLVTFRGDNDESWRRAENFIAAEIAAQSTVDSGQKPPAKIAVFDFELQDVSGGAGVIAQSADDSEQLRRATLAARKLIADSGRYRLVDVDGADDAAVKAHDLRECDGCDAPIAARLGADLSLVGIVTRITRTDYAVTFRLRDARTGELAAVEQTDLRIGANYSWDRGAAWLIERKLLAQKSP
jgi:hypothetical protein